MLDHTRAPMTTYTNLFVDNPSIMLSVKGSCGNPACDIPENDPCDTCRPSRDLLVSVFMMNFESFVTVPTKVYTMVDTTRSLIPIFHICLIYTSWKRAVRHACAMDSMYPVCEEEWMQKAQGPREVASALLDAKAKSMRQEWDDAEKVTDRRAKVLKVLTNLENELLYGLAVLHASTEVDGMEKRVDEVFVKLMSAFRVVECPPEISPYVRCGDDKDYWIENDIFNKNVVLFKTEPPPTELDVVVKEEEEEVGAIEKEEEEVSAIEKEETSENL